MLPGGRGQGALQWNLLSHEEEVLKELLRQHARTNCGQWIRQFNINKISLLKVRNQGEAVGERKSYTLHEYKLQAHAAERGMEDTVLKCLHEIVAGETI